MKEFLAIVRNPNLGLLLTGRMISSGGDWLYQIALSIAIFKYSGGSSFMVGLLWIVRLVPAMFLGPFGGVLADRLGYRRAMILSDLTRMVLVAILAVLLQKSDWIVIYPFAFLVTSAGSIFRPASVGIIPSLVRSREERLAANASTMQIEALSGIIGSAIGGVIAGMGLINQLLYIEAATFGFSALALFFIRTHAVQSVEESVSVGTESEDGDAMEEGFVAGIRSLARRPLLVFSAMAMALPELASGAMVIWVVPYAVQSLGLGNAGVGYLYSALGVGSLLGGFTAAALGGNVRLDKLLGISVAITGISIVIFGVVHVAVAALACLLVIGISETMEYAAYQTLLQQAVPENAIGRASGTMDSLLLNMMLIGTACSGLLVAAFGLTLSIAGLGILIVMATGLAWLFLQRSTSGQPDAHALAKIPAFAAVPVSVREWAVRRMARELVPPGGVIVRQGDEGEKFYTIARGTVSVEVQSNGHVLTRELGPGEFFGEIALLQKIPRTATVRAADAVTLWSMSRDDFEDLQSRAADFKDSLWETASARLEESTNFMMALASRP